MVDPTAQPHSHCPRFPEHCSLECMERMRAQFGSFNLNDPPLEQWCLLARQEHAEEEERRRFEAEKLSELRQQLFPPHAKD